MGAQAGVYFRALGGGDVLFFEAHLGELVWGICVLVCVIRWTIPGSNLEGDWGEGHKERDVRVRQLPRERARLGKWLPCGVRR